MRPDVTPGWRFVSIGFDGADVLLEGVNPWKHEGKWHQTSEEPITVAHPSYPTERHTMFIYELTIENRTITFAAGEFSNGVWGFYLPK